MTKPHQWCNQISVAVTAYSPEGQVIGTWNLAYDPSTLALTNETIVAGGEMSVLARTQDSFGRVSGFTLNDDYSISYGFAGDGRFSGLSSVIGHQSSNSWQYSYLQDSELISMISNQQSVTTTKSYENHRNLLTEVHNKSQSVTISKYQYENDALGRRTQRVDTTVSVITNDFGYDARSQLTNAVMGAENFAWAFDNIGNRETYTHPTGSGQATNLYTANELNQYTSISNGGVKTLTYDLDGNLVTDGTWSNVWNGENRPVLIEPMNPSNGSERVELAYDYQGRRIKEKISVYSGSAWSVVRTNFWLYDGWNPVQEVVLTASGTETNWWTHGLDLSGTLQGAGGIGGFLAWTRASDGKTFLYSGDANGNITELVDASNPTNIVASYQWDAYGDSISMFGSEAENNVFRWSSKYVIVQTGDKDYGYRILRDHRWLSRDPIGEWGGFNLYSYLLNSPLSDVDYLGLMEGSVHVVGRHEVVYYISSNLYGGVFPTLLENSCECACSKRTGKYELSCKLDIGYYIFIATKDSSVWDDAPIGYPSLPTPPDWGSLSYSEKVKHILEHERRHVQAYRDWHAKRKWRIEAFEQLVYLSKSECDQRGTILVDENSKGYTALRKAQRSHEGW